MTILFNIFFFIYGLVFGSFFNVVGLRVPSKTLFSQTRSYCDTCNRTLTWSELIPVVSYVFQRGKCRTCHQRISPLYPIMELLTGLLFFMTYYYYGISWHMALGFLLIALIIPITVSDIVYRKIPNRLLLIFLPVFFIYRFFFPLVPYWSSFQGALVAFALVFSIILLSKGGMGAGDLKYFTLLGFILGWQQFLLLFFLSTLYGALYGSLIMVIKKASRKLRIPFGPFIGMAAMTVYFYGEPLINWYWNLFL